MFLENAQPPYKIVTFEPGVFIDQRPINQIPLNRCALFSDSTALREIARLVQIGCVGPSNFHDVQGIQSTLGTAWDYWCAESDLIAMQRSIHQRDPVLAYAWIHVVSSDLKQLTQARELGLKTCFLPRPLGVSATEGEAFKPDMLVSDLFQLHEGLIAHMGPATYIAIAVNVEHPKLIREMLRWFRYDGAILLEEIGSQEFCIKKMTPLNAVIEIHAKERAHIARVQEKILSALKETFPANAVAFQAARAEICLEQRFQI